MRNYSKILSSNDVKNVIDALSGYKVYPKIIPGGLVDNLFFEDMEAFYFKSAKPRKYWMITEEYLNEWSSQYRLIMTDDAEKYHETINDYLVSLEEFQLE